MLGTVGVVRLITYPHPTALGLIGPAPNFLVEDVEALSARCREHVERGSDFDSSDLTPTDMPTGFNGVGQVDHQAWRRRPDSPVIAVTYNYVRTDWTPGPRLQCQVTIDEAYALTELSQALLLRSFLDTRIRHLVEGTHEADDPAFDPSFHFFGYSPHERGPSGCRVIHVLMMSQAGDSFQIASGEQGGPACQPDGRLPTRPQPPA